jgi:hypothetical protein
LILKLKHIWFILVLIFLNNCRLACLSLLVYFYYLILFVRTWDIVYQYILLAYLDKILFNFLILYWHFVFWIAINTRIYFSKFLKLEFIIILLTIYSILIWIWIFIGRRSLINLKNFVFLCLNIVLFLTCLWDTLFLQFNLDLLSFLVNYFW